MDSTYEQTFRTIFRRYYSPLLFYAAGIVGDKEAEDVVQDVFVELWKKGDMVRFGGYIQAYLYRAVYSRCLNVLKHRSVKENYCAARQEIDRQRAKLYNPDDNNVMKRMESKDLRAEIRDAIEELPEKCREVFMLSYIHNMKNKDIAEVLGISQRTVEAHMYNALKFLRRRLGHLWFLVLLFLVVL